MQLRFATWILARGLKPCLNPDWDLNPWSFKLRSHSWSQDLKKLRFLMPPHWENAVRDKVMGKKQIYLERNTDGECSHEIKRRLLLGRKAMTNLDSILKSRDIIIPTKIHIVKAMIFPVVMYRCESWTIKKTEHHRIDAFELWCWRRLLRVP